MGFNWVSFGADNRTCSEYDERNSKQTSLLVLRSVICMKCRLQTEFADNVSHCRKSVVQSKGQKKRTVQVRFFRQWCGQQDLNLHEPNAHKNLNLARLPIPPCPHSFAILAYPRRIVNSFGQFGQNVVNFQKFRPS